MVSRSNRSLERRRGAAIVEMAIVLPVFMTIMLGIVEFGRAMSVSGLMLNAARHGARLAIIDGSTNAGVIDAVKTLLEETCDVPPQDADVSIQIQPAPGNSDPANNLQDAQLGDIVTIAVSVRFGEVSYFTPKWLSTSVLRQKASMRHE